MFIKNRLRSVSKRRGKRLILLFHGTKILITTTNVYTLPHYLKISSI